MRQNIIAVVVLSLSLIISGSQTATATSATVDVQPAKNPEVRFVDGLVTVKAKEVEAIGKETGMAVSVSESLKAEKVTIQFEAITRQFL